MTSLDSRLAVVLDVGTTTIRVVVFDHTLAEVFSRQNEVKTLHPQAGWAEQDPRTILKTCRELLVEARAFVGSRSSTLGITNQRESVVAWDRSTGKPLSQLILWSDKRTEAYCNELKQRGYEQLIRSKTGLLLTPYSSAPKAHWLLEQPEVRACPSLAIGTLDSWIIFSLTGNFLTDYTNASRTMLFNIQTRTWDQELLDIFEVDKSLLPPVQPSRSNFGSYNSLDGQEPIQVLQAVIGDQQASMYAAGTMPGTTKITYGTGIFPMRIVGNTFQLKDNYLTTLAIGPSGDPTYALEGKVENAAPRVSAVYGINQPAFDKLMIELAYEASPVIDDLVDANSVVYVDGGISQNDDILAEQEKLNHVTLRRHSTHNGSALGVAKLLFSGE